MPPSVLVLCCSNFDRISDCDVCFTSLGKIRAVHWDLPGCELGLALLVLLACVFLSNALGRSSTQCMCSSLPWLFSHSPDVAAPCGERGAKKNAHVFWGLPAIRSQHAASCVEDPGAPEPQMGLLNRRHRLHNLVVIIYISCCI